MLRHPLLPKSSLTIESRGKIPLRKVGKTKREFRLEKDQ